MRYTSGAISVIVDMSVLHERIDGEHYDGVGSPQPKYHHHFFKCLSKKSHVAFSAFC